MSTISPERLAEVFVAMADTLVDDFDLIEFLQAVTSHTSELVDAQAAGLLLADHHQRLQVMAASDERAEMLELFQVQMHEGPCLDCFRQSAPVTNSDLRQASDRWPVFAPKAVDSGFRSVHAFPLRLRHETIGALNLFGADATPMSPTDVRMVQALADVATIGLMQERAVRHSEQLSEQLQTALNTRIVIEQAKGALAQIHNGNPDEGFALLRAYSRRRGLRLSEVALAVIENPSSIPDLTVARPV